MKILIITDAWHPQINGVVRTYEYLKAPLEKRGHEVFILGPNDFQHKIPMPGYAEIELALFPHKELSQKIDRINPDHIHIATEGPLGWAARKICKKNNHVFSTAYHTQFPEYTAKRVASLFPFLYKCTHRIGVNYVRRFHATSAAIMVATKSLEDQLLSWEFKNTMTRLTRGADLSIFHLGEKTLFQELKRPIALYVGRIAIEKNIEAFLKMNWNGSKVLIGDGPGRIHLEKQYSEAYFLGKKSGKELADTYRSADLFVFPSKTDTFGMVLIEALACGLPVAGYNVTGPKDIITEEFLGAIDDDLSTAAARALSNDKESARHEYIQNNFTWDIAAEQFEITIKKHCSPPSGQ
ncbi:MAG: glycosyltransferase family 1 protein [Micavibrio sp.]|nr:glycosyltransferase family 1 protein [Micavibrio sp.]